MARLWWCGLETSVVKPNLKANLSANKLVVLPHPVDNNPQPTQSNHQDTGVADSGASNIFFAKEAPIQNFNAAAPKVHVGMATVQLQESIGTGIPGLPHLPSDFPRTVQVMPSLKHKFIGLGIICDSDCNFFFTKQYFVVYQTQQQLLITGWREPNGAKLWRISLPLSPSNISTPPTNTTRESLQTFSTYDLMSVKALVRYFHAAAGSPVRNTWLQAIKYGNQYSWPGLTSANTDKYCPSSDRVQPKTSPFSTCHIIWVNYKVGSQSFQLIYLSLSYLNGVRHFSFIEVCRDLFYFILFLRFQRKSTKTFFAVDFLAFSIMHISRFVSPKSSQFCG